MIRFENVDFTYSANPNEKSLYDVTFEVTKGECVLLTGASGCGKSTLLRLLNGMIPEFYQGKRNGRIYINETEISEKGIYDFVGMIGSVFQNPRSQFFNVDTTSELAFGCENLAMPEEEILQRIDDTVSEFGIQKLMDRNIFELSGGEKQKIACASVDVLCPDIILLDEPSANLDYEGTENLRQTIEKWKQQGKTILIAEHRINYLWTVASRVIIMENGEIKRDLNQKDIMSFTDEMCRENGLRSMERVSPVALGHSLMRADTNSGERIIELKNFSYAYRGKDYIFDLPDIGISEGKVTAVVGSNGTGKSTFLECLCGVRRNKGRMLFREKEYKSKGRLKQMFMVMQDPNHQLFTESVLDEVLISMPDEDAQRAKAILQEVDLSEFADRHPMSLSGGQKQRVAIACAIASECPILLLDEPTSGLDLEHMLAVANILNRLKDQGRTIIIVTRDSEFIETCCDEIVELSEVSR